MAHVNAVTPDFSDPIACCVAGASIHETALFTVSSKPAQPAKQKAITSTPA
jgi:hypothetical protein